jgi:diguanylate cyclase (GGDEF)-like protein
LRVTSDQTTPLGALQEAARLLARGGDLDARLAGLAELALRQAGARRAEILLFDGASGQLVSAAAAGDGAGPAPEVLEQVARTRRPEQVAGSVAVPLVTQDTAGTEQVQGVLAVTGAPSEPAVAGLDLLAILADLAAAAVHAARLERALEERTDWFERVAHTDPLTGLANRRTFERMLELELARGIRQGSPISVAVFDVDGLGELSRRHGADVGDDVLRRVASTLADSVRLVDTVARFGGDEFVVLAPGSAGRTVAERIAAAVAGLDAIAGGDAITVSGGVARFPEDGADAETLLAAAEAALNNAKALGTGSVVLSDSAARDNGSGRSGAAGGETASTAGSSTG